MDTNNGADITENSDNGLANESMDGGRSRFSVTSYFTRLNRFGVLVIFRKIHR